LYEGASGQPTARPNAHRCSQHISTQDIKQQPPVFLNAYRRVVVLHFSERHILRNDLIGQKAHGPAARKVAPTISRFTGSMTSSCKTVSRLNPSRRHSARFMLLPTCPKGCG